MAIPTVGETFRDFEAQGISSKELRTQKPSVFVIWKTSCPVCRLAMPFFDRMQKVYPNANVIGIAQEMSQDLHAYAQANGLDFRQVADEDLKVTRQFEVTHVPSYWLTDSTGEVLEEGVGWDRKKIEGIGKKIAAMTGAEVQALVREEDDVPDFKPG